jgi:hypothetical protein
MIADLFYKFWDYIRIWKWPEPIEIRKHRRRKAERAYFTAWTPLHARIVRAGLDIQTWGPRTESQDGFDLPGGRNVPRSPSELLEGLEMRAN